MNGEKELALTREFFFLRLSETFGFPFTKGQEHAALLLTHFVTTHQPYVACILRGYAGTGKTSLIGALVKVMQQTKQNVVSLAPTGRAAKVFSRIAGTPAYTIHHAIYRQQSFQGDDTKFSLGYNKLKNTLFIVDEASMINIGESRATPFGSGELMNDLINFVYTGEGCRLLLVGDTAQLPPVGEEESPALNDEIIKGYGLLVGSADLTEVVRQKQESNVLDTATKLRLMLQNQSTTFLPIPVKATKDIHTIRGDEIIENLIDDYQNFGTDNVIVITRSNKMANIYNNGIRSRIFYREDILTRNDIVMVAKNNYYWTSETEKKLSQGEQLPINFIANGDTAEVLHIRNIHEQYGFCFADATLRFPDYEDMEIDCRLLLTTLQSESPSLTQDESQRLYESVLEDYQYIPQKKERMKALRQDPYYNALQVKYAYAVTCHKAQGGQWARVYIDQGYIPSNLLGKQYLRWLYTAFTRTTDCLYLINTNNMSIKE